MLTVSSLYIYPVKSLGGISVDAAAVTSRGLEHDRRLMLVDENNCLLTQRTHPIMALLQPSFQNARLCIGHKENAVAPFLLPDEPRGETIRVTVWDDTCDAIAYEPAVNEWFSDILQTACRLVYMPDDSHREVDKRYAKNNEIVSFADGYPMLLIGQASLDDLNSRLEQPLPMDRFRPSIVFTGGEPFLEDRLRSFSISGISFTGVKPCARCIMTTINQQNAQGSKEPLKTLAGFRQYLHKILFGQNLVHRGEGTIRVGDVLEVESYQEAIL